MNGPSNAAASRSCELVLKAILAREADGLPLNHVAVLRDDPQLHTQILRLYGMWDQAMQAAGIDPKRVRRHRRWSHEAIIERIQQRDALALPLNAAAVQKSEATLANAAERWFGSWSEALDAACIDPSQWRRRVPKWTQARVVAAIRRIRDKGGKLNHAAVGRKSLSHAAVDLFGCWDAALGAAGLDPTIIRGNRRRG